VNIPKALIDVGEHLAEGAVLAALRDENPIAKEAARAGIAFTAAMLRHVADGADARSALVAAAGERGFVEVERLEDERAKRKFPDLESPEHPTKNSL
jgi:hypothetical protein